MLHGYPPAVICAFLLPLAASQACVAGLSFQAVRHVGVIAVSH